jgi:hypothetical protein
MRLRLVTRFAAAVALVAATVASASTEPAKHATGKVTRIDLAKGKLEMVNGNVTQRFRIDAATSCTANGAKVDLARIAAGTPLLVDWKLDYDRNVATHIEVLAAPVAGDAAGSH